MCARLIQLFIGLTSSAFNLQNKSRFFGIILQHRCNITSRRRILGECTGEINIMSEVKRCVDASIHRDQTGLRRNETPEELVYLVSLNYGFELAHVTGERREQEQSGGWMGAWGGGGERKRRTARARERKLQQKAGLTSVSCSSLAFPLLHCILSFLRHFSFLLSSLMYYTLTEMHLRLSV